MKEKLVNPPNLEDNNSAEKAAKQHEDEKKISRREFLKTAGIIGGTLAAGIGGGFIAAKRERQEEKEHVHQGEGVVTGKIDTPAWKQMGPMMPSGRIFVPGPPIRHPESFSIKIKVNEKEYTANISKEEFNALTIGEKVSLKYDDRDMTASAIEKAK